MTKMPKEEEMYISPFPRNVSAPWGLVVDPDYHGFMEKVQRALESIGFNRREMYVLLSLLKEVPFGEPLSHEKMMELRQRFLEVMSRTSQDGEQ